MNKLYTLLLLPLFLLTNLANAQTAHINEFHYNNTGADDQEYVEIAVQSGFQCHEPMGLQVLLYDGHSGAVYHTAQVPQVGNAVMGGHLYVIQFPSETVKNGGPHGIALVCGTQVLQFISYGGTFRAMEGTASGLTSLDVEKTESENTPVDGSLYYSNGQWNVSSTINPASPGALNPNQISLPVVLKSFDVIKVDHGAKIEWTAAEEEEVNFYVVQWSQDAHSFNGKKRFDNTLAGFYSYLDKNCEVGDNFYRLEVHNIDGTIDYSPTLKVYNNNRNPNAVLKLIENPVQNNWLLFSVSGFETNPEITIIDAIGKIYSYNLSSQGEQKLDVSKLAPGTYFLRASDASATRMVRFVK